MATREVMLVKPQECTCSYQIEQSGSTLALVRNQGVACPVPGHGDPLSIQVEHAVKSVMFAINKVRGMERINEAQVRRIIHAALPSFQPGGTDTPPGEVLPPAGPPITPGGGRPR